MYFREAVAKAIVFRSVERLVSGQPWYQGGYRAYVVAYTIAKIANTVGHGAVLEDDRVRIGFTPLDCRALVPDEEREEG